MSKRPVSGASRRTSPAIASKRRSEATIAREFRLPGGQTLCAWARPAFDLPPRLYESSNAILRLSERTKADVFSTSSRRGDGQTIGGSELLGFGQSVEYGFQVPV